MPGKPAPDGSDESPETDVPEDEEVEKES